LALVGEFAPDKARGKLLGFTQVAWCLGPAIVLWMAALFAGFNHPILQPNQAPKPGVVYGHLDQMFTGMMGARLVFMHLFIVALITWALRRGLAESARWVAASATVKKSLGSLFSGANLRAFLWTAIIYTFQNLAGGTAGQFNPYFITTLHVGSDAQAAAMFSMAFVTVMLVTWFVFMPFFDTSFRSRKWIWGVGSILQIVAYGMFIFLPFTTVTVVTNIIMFAAGTALAGEAFYKVFSQELFPTMLRGTAQGFTFGIARAALGFWSFFVPSLLIMNSGASPSPAAPAAIVVATQSAAADAPTTTPAVPSVEVTPTTAVAATPPAAAAATPNFVPIASILTVFLLISGIVGFFGMPDTSGKSLEQIESERAGT
jgi:inositol transporter-like SP family MFS transporter